MPIWRRLTRRAVTIAGIDKGIHFCIGSALGKLEARLALELLTQRFPSFRLVPSQTLTFHPNIAFRGPQTLWAEVR